MSRAALSGAYPLQLGLSWGRALSMACQRMAKQSALAWAQRRLLDAERLTPAKEEHKVKDVVKVPFKDELYILYDFRSNLAHSSDASTCQKTSRRSRK